MGPAPCTWRKAYHACSSSPQALPVPPAGDSSGAQGEPPHCGQVGVSQAAAWPVQLFLQGGTWDGGRQRLQKASEHMAQGLAVGRLRASSTLGLGGPNWLKVGVPWLVRLMAS